MIEARVDISWQCSASRKSAVSDDDDDFIVPSDSELSVHDHSSVMSTSSRRSTGSRLSDGFESDPESPVRRKKTQTLSKGRKSHSKPSFSDRQAADYSFRQRERLPIARLTSSRQQNRE